MQHAYKIIIPHLVIGGEKLDVPVGLSEILESTWSKEKNDDSIGEIVNRYNRTVYKQENGRWATKYELK